MVFLHLLICNLTFFQPPLTHQFLNEAFSIFSPSLMYLKSVDPSPFVAKSPSRTNFTIGNTFWCTNLAIILSKLPLAANPPTDSKASQTDAGSGSPEDMVCCAINQRDVLQCCCHGTTMQFVWAMWFDLKTRPSCFCACHHCHVFRQEVLV